MAGAGAACALIVPPPARPPARQLAIAGAKALTAAGVLTLLLLGRQRGGAVGTGALLLAGSLAERFAIFGLGLYSAKDPRYTVVPQRERAAMPAR